MIGACRKSAGKVPRTELAASVTPSDEPWTNFPAAFFTAALARPDTTAYWRSPYPTAPSVCLTLPDTPSLPGAPLPTGQLTDLPAPTAVCHSALTLSR